MFRGIQYLEEFNESSMKFGHGVLLLSNAENNSERLFT